MASRVRRAWLAVLAAGCLAAVGGCAAVPISGVAQPMAGTTGQPQQFVQPLPPPGPGPGEQASYVVSGFLHASASFAIDPSAARAFLASNVKWKPSGTVTIVSPDLTFGPTIRLPSVVSGESGVQQIVVTGQRIATINTSGQYSYQSGAPTEYRFTLAKFGRKLLITQLPPGQQLLLTQSDFEEVFRPYNLYFYAPGAFPSGALVPDPVYAPVQGPTSALSTTVADSLVNGLIKDRGSWLSGPTATEFPAGTTLLRPVAISNQTALVDLGGKADTASKEGQLPLMYAQLEQTLTSSAYGPPVANSVQLAIDGKIQYSSDSANIVPVAGSAVGGPRAQTLYFASNGVVKQLPAGRKAAAVVPGLAQLANPAGISALAVSTVGPSQVAVAVPQGAGCAILVHTPGLAVRRFTLSVSGGPCTSLSWDNTGSLWAVAGAGIWVLQAGPDNQPVSVALPPLVTGRSRVVELRMAPDAVRGAMLVRTAGHMQLYVAAVKFGNKGVGFGPAVPVGTDLAASGVSAVGWYNPYYLLTVSGSQLYQVPLTGGQSLPLASGALPAGVQSLTAAGNELAVATDSGAVYTSLSPYISWTQLPGRASAPAFPG